MGAERDTKKWEAGLKVMDQVYGPGVSTLMEGRQDQPLIYDTVTHQFGELWADPTLSIRDKRLMVLGVTAMLGRIDLVATQITGAIRNKELTEAQLAEIPRFLASYAGAGNATAVFQGIQKAIADSKAKP